MAKGKFVSSMIDLINRSGLSNDEQLQFLHNTRAEALRGYNDMGGIPMPSIAIAREGSSFNDFGEITLVGRQNNFDPLNRLNETYGADAYTVRAPSSVRMVDKTKLKQMNAKGGFFDAVKQMGGYVDSVRSSAYDLTSKKGMQESRYRDLTDFFDRDKGVDALFLSEKGIDIPKDSAGKADFSFVREKVNSMLDERKAWGDQKKSELLDDQKYFISNPDRDYYSQSAKLMPYTSENVTAFMSKKSGAVNEGGVFSSGGGANRAAVVGKFGTLDEVRNAKERLVGAGSMDEAKKISDEAYSHLEEKLLSGYKYDSFAIADDITNALKIYNKKGAAPALKAFGFDASDKEAVDLFRDYAEGLKKMPTEYFEVKPKRSVGVNEFGAAIMPKDAPSDVVDMLTKKGLDIHRYSTPQERDEIRKSLGKFSFQAATIGGIGAGAALTATPQNSYADSLHDVVMKAKPSTREIMDAQRKREDYLKQIEMLNRDDNAIQAPESNAALSIASGMDKYNKERKKRLNPVLDFVLPAGELPVEYMTKIGYGDEITFKDRLNAVLGML